MWPASMLASMLRNFIGALGPAAFHAAMLEQGVYLAPSAYETAFVSLAHTEAQIDATIAAAAESMKGIQ